MEERRSPTHFLRKDIPICPEHGLVMKSYKKKGRVAYYRCPNKDCTCKGKCIARIIQAP